VPIVNTYFEITASFTFLASFFLVNEEKWDGVEIARLFLNRPSEIRCAPHYREFHCAQRGKRGKVINLFLLITMLFKRQNTDPRFM